MTQLTTLPTRLNLGCGSLKKPGFLNVDIATEVAPDMIWDLNNIPYPFPDNQFELIEAEHVLEHLHDPMRVMTELYRIAKPGAEIHIRVPHFSRGFTHPDHKCGFGVVFPNYFEPSFQGGNQGVSLKLLRMRLRWMGLPHIKKTYLSPPLFYTVRIIGGIIDFFANLSPYLASRLWCYWVGGFEEIEYRFQVIKP